jgi:hypothetical protein
MSPADFLTLARTLSKSAGEAELRSAVSRAYYSAFHSARILIESCGVQLPLSASAHEKITNCMQQSTDQGLQTVGTSKPCGTGKLPTNSRRPSLSNSEIE